MIAEDAIPEPQAALASVPRDQHRRVLDGLRGRSA